MPPLGTRTTNSTKIRVARTGNTTSPNGSLGMMVNWAIPVLIPCFLDLCTVLVRDPELPYPGLLHPGEQHLILAEYYFPAGA